MKITSGTYVCRSDGTSTNRTRKRCPAFLTLFVHITFSHSRTPGYSGYLDTDDPLYGGMLLKYSKQCEHEANDVYNHGHKNHNRPSQLHATSGNTVAHVQIAVRKQRHAYICK